MNPPWRRAFVTALEALDPSRESARAYGTAASGDAFYRYVGGNPIGFTDASGLQYIPPAAMQHILAGHGCNTQRTRPGNSVFSPEYSNPAALQQLSNDVFAAPGGPPQPYYGRLESIQGQVNLQNQETGETVPYPIGTAGNGMSTNAVRIIYDPATGNVETMYPIPPQ
jgi:hypothetical protein